MCLSEWIKYGFGISFVSPICFGLFIQNVEAEKQVKFFQGCVAAAFAERDHSIMEVIPIIRLR